MKGVPIISDEHMKLLITLRKLRTAINEAKYAMIDSNLSQEDVPYDVVYDWFNIITKSLPEFSVDGEKGTKDEIHN